MPESIVPYDKTLPYIEDRNPWEISVSYLKKKAVNEYELIQGRRPSKMLIVNKLRSDIDRWRNDGYPGATATSQELLAYWFEQSHPPVFGNEPFHFYFCQREAVETIIYLYEIKKYTDVIPLIEDYHEKYMATLFSSVIEFSEDLDGRRKVKRYFPELNQEGEQELPEKDLLRYAVKMATGSGKTFVMAFVVVWSYFNRLREKDRRYANNFLLVAPNVIVYERLAKDFANGKVFEEFPFVPTAWKSKWKLNIKLRGDESPLAAENNLIVNNIHQLYESRAKEFNPNTIIEAILGRKPNADPGKSPQTLLERIKELDNLLVMNDEAHHVHDDELKWNESLLSIHKNIPGGLKMWLDFSATPKTPENTYYPWIICDYPLAQAVEDRIVKVPLIVHSVNKKEPDKITKDNVVQKYGDWISAALSRWKEHYDAYKSVEKKPVLFIMAEKNVFADKIAESIAKNGSPYGIAKDEIMIIHTDNSGNVRKSDLESLREEARDVDNPKNKIKVIVSVLMLREGWDVQNVTIVLGLRAFDSAILPEQAIGRGLRLMRDISPDRTQTLEVIGNENFEKIVKQLELEGVGINTTSTPPPLPVTIAPEKRRLKYDIEIPSTDFSYTREYKNLRGIDPLIFPTLFESNLIDAEKGTLEITIRDFIVDTEVHQGKIEIEGLETIQDIIGAIVLEVMKKAKLTDCFHILYPIVEKYIAERCFRGKVVDMNNVKLRSLLRRITYSETISDLLSREIGKATVEKKQVKIKGKNIKLSETPKFTWSRKHIRCEKTVFNFVATYNPFESEFAEFLDKADDIDAFSALADIFRIDYLSNSGAIRYYFPDFIAVQSVEKKKVYWILETKGREYPDLENKNKAIERWCSAVTKQTGNEWKYLLIKQAVFNIHKQAVTTLKQLEEKINNQTRII